MEELLGARGKAVYPTGDGEQIELFWSKGQAIVLGITSPRVVITSGRGVDQLGPPTSQWRDQLLKILLWPQAFKSHQHLAIGSIYTLPDLRRDAPDCRINAAENMVLCHHGKRWHPPEMRVGETNSADHCGLYP